MITNKDLQEKYGEDIVFLFKGDEPYVETHGKPAGVLIEKDNKILCNECGEWFSHLGYHLQAHDLNAEKYKEKYGFNRNAPLCSRETSNKLRESALKVKNDPIKRAKMIDSLKRGRTKEVQEKRTGTKKRMQGLNIRNACPEQMKQRYTLIIIKYGKDVSLNIIRKVDPGLDAYGCRHFGSWNEFKKSLGFEIDTSSKKKEKSNLIYDLREYVNTNKSLPWDSYTHGSINGFPHSKTPYVANWGSLRKAMFACGVECGSEFVSDSKGRKKEWSLIK